MCNEHPQHPVLPHFTFQAVCISCSFNVLRCLSIFIAPSHFVNSFDLCCFIFPSHFVYGNLRSSLPLCMRIDLVNVLAQVDMIVSTCDLNIMTYLSDRLLKISIKVGTRSKQKDKQCFVSHRDIISTKNVQSFLRTHQMRH